MKFREKSHHVSHASYSIAEETVLQLGDNGKKFMIKKYFPYGYLIFDKKKKRQEYTMGQR